MKNHTHIITLALLAIVCALTTNVWAQYTETTLYNFAGGSDGYLPLAGLTADGVGNLYGTTYEGGLTSCVTGCGTLFELSPLPAAAGPRRYSSTLRAKGPAPRPSGP